MARITRVITEVYGDNVVNEFFTFNNSGSWTVSNGGSASHDNNIIFEGSRSLRLINTDPNNGNTTASITGRGTVVNEPGNYWIVCYLRNDTNEQITGSFRTYKNTVIENTATYTLEVADEDIWIGQWAYVTGLLKGDILEFDFVIDQKTPALPNIAINIDGFGVYHNDRGLTLPPRYTSPVPAQKELFGVYDYNDLATQTTQIPLTLADTQYELTNDGAGSNTNKTYALTNLTDIWNTSTNRFEFNNGSVLELGDTVDIRFDVEVTTGSANTAVEMSMELGVGASPYQLPLIPSVNFKTAGTYKLVRWFSVYMGDANTLDNPSRILMEADTTGATVQVNGWYIRPMKRIV